MNTIKTLFLLVTLTLVLIWAGGTPGGKQGMTIALIIALGINFISYWFSDNIVLLSGAEIAGNARYLSGALRKLDAASRQIPMQANPANSHMFFVNPFAGGGLLKLFSTHPIEERIARLESINR